MSDGVWWVFFFVVGLALAASDDHLFTAQSGQFMVWQLRFLRLCCINH